MGNRSEVVFMRDAVVLPGAQLPLRFTDDQVRVMRMAIEKIGDAPIAVTLNVDDTGVDFTFCLVFPDRSDRGVGALLRQVSACEQMAGELRSILQTVKGTLEEVSGKETDG